MSSETAAGQTQAPAPSRPSPGPLEFLWRALNSLPVAIFVMLALALLSAVGTLIPQEHLQPQPAGMTFRDFLTERYGAQKYGILRTLGFDHVYFTWYFNALLTWLAVSAVICNIVRWRTTWRLWQTPVVRRGARFFAADKRSWLFSAGGADVAARGEVTAAPALTGLQPQAVANAVAEDLQLLGYRVRREQEEGGATMLYADRGFAKKWALVGLHIAILVLLFGGFYGRAVGVDGQVRMADGEQHTLTIDVAERKFDWIKPVLEKLPLISYELQQHSFRIDWGEKLVLETDLEQNVPEELKEYYRYYVDDYVSDLEVTNRGRTLRREVKVNHPLVINKLVLYQSGYDQRGYLKISRTGASPVSNESPEKTGEGAGPTEIRIPDPLFGAETWYALTADDIAVWDPTRQRWFIPVVQGEDIMMNFVEPAEVSAFGFAVRENVKSGDLFKHNKKVGRIGPMAIFTMRDNTTGMEMGSLLVTDKQGFDTRVAGQRVSLRLSEKVDDYSVFAYKRDPGSPILFLGWIMMVAGIALTMYVPFTQLWVRAEPGTLSVLALGPARRRLKRRLDALLGVESA